MLRLELTGISKQYPAVKANDRVDLRVEPGQIHAILGENGAGKSTLMKIIYGAVQPDEGSLKWNGENLTIGSPAHARSVGISMVYQHFSLFDTLTVAENVWLGMDRTLSLAQITERVVDVARRYGLDVDPARPVHTLSVGEMQRVEIIRALLGDPKLLILDEPTSVLTPQAVERLFVVLRQLAEQGCSILYISHKLHEIRELCSACTVLRAGRVAGICDPRAESNASLSRMMIGAEPPALPRHSRTPGATVLRIDHLGMVRDSPFGVDLDIQHLALREGEVLGVAGVSGNGQKEFMRMLSGEDLRPPTGQLQVLGHEVGRLGPAQRRDLGMRFVPEERLGRGAVPTMSLAHNLLLTDAARGPWISPSALARRAGALIDRFKVKAGGPLAPARSLSGGNLQKFIVGREVSAVPKLLIVAQPTWGVDVGAAALIRAEMLRLRDEGCAVLLISEELEELFDMSDRMVVMARGRMSPALPRDQATVELIGEWMSGLWPSSKSTWEVPHVAA